MSKDFNLLLYQVPDFDKGNTEYEHPLNHIFKNLGILQEPTVENITNGKFSFFLHSNLHCHACNFSLLNDDQKKSVEQQGFIIEAEHMQLSFHLFDYESFQDLKSLKETFVDHLRGYGKRLVMVIDSLDQLRDAGAGLRDWIPAQLPNNVHLILSTIPGAEYKIEPQLKVCTDLIFLWLANLKKTYLGIVIIDYFVLG